MDIIAPYMNYILIALVVIAILILLVIVMRAFGGRVRGRKGKRLGISEYKEIDKSRRLLLIRRDDVEHLVMIGGGQSLVIEQNINGEDENNFASPPVSRPREVHTEPDPEPQIEERREPVAVHRPAPRAPVFAERAPNVRPIHRDEPRFRPDDDDY